MIGLVGKKKGMTRIFNKDGTSIPVTIIEIKNNRITQIKNIRKEGYDSIQVTTGLKKTSRLKKPEIGHFAKANVAAGIGLWEFRFNKETLFKIGQEISVDFFSNIKKIDVSGVSKGKGFCGTVKRWNFSTQDATHGNSLSHRAPGSIGQNQTPGKVFKGKKMAGQLGNEKITIQNLKVILIDSKKNLLFVKGSVPGAVNGNVIVKPAIKV